MTDLEEAQFRTDLGKVLDGCVRKIDPSARAVCYVDKAIPAEAGYHYTICFSESAGLDKKGQGALIPFRALIQKLTEENYLHGSFDSSFHEAHCANDHLVTLVLCAQNKNDISGAVHAVAAKLGVPHHSSTAGETVEERIDAIAGNAITAAHSAMKVPEGSSFEETADKLLSAVHTYVHGVLHNKRDADAEAIEKRRIHKLFIDHGLGNVWKEIERKLNCLLPESQRGSNGMAAGGR